MTPEEINRKIDRLVTKRDYAADVLGSPVLAWSYQQDIDKLVALLPPTELPSSRTER